MVKWRRPNLATVVIIVSAFVAAIAVGAFAMAASGLYNVAASRGHFAITSWLLAFGMQRSVATHSILVTSPSLADPDLVRLGAAHFDGGCALCHGAPGKARNPVVEGMLPSPPDLSNQPAKWTPEQLFWIVKNGLKYTGMPAWPSQQRDDEVWAVVAFLLRLPDMSPEQYRRLARGEQELVRRDDSEVVNSGSDSTALTACIRCHDGGDAPTSSRFVPILTGQSAAYLENALRDYAEGRRQSGIMQPIAASLEPEDVQRLARYYAGLPRAASAPDSDTESERIARGRKIAEQGERGIPPCVACHVEGNADIFPRLAGQQAAYISRQLKLWQAGLRDRTARGAIMASIARRLNDQQIDDVAAYFSHLSPAESARRQTRERP